MAVRPICIVGDPVLHTATEPVPVADDGSLPAEIADLIQDLYDTMDAAHGVGLAANQIGVGKRLFVYDCADARGKTLRRRGVVINPVLETSEVPETMPDPEDDDEGCLSVPGLRGPVRRAVGLQVRFREPSGARGALELTGLFARIVLHELDHLDGVLFLDRVAAEDRERIGFREELEAAGLSSGVVGATPAVLRELDAGRRSTAGE